MFPQAGIESGDTLDDMLGIVLHKAKTAKVGNQMHVSLSLDLFFPPSYFSLIFLSINCGRISSVDRPLDCRAGGHGFDSWGCTNTQGLKITEK